MLDSPLPLYPPPQSTVGVSEPRFSASRLLTKISRGTLSLLAFFRQLTICKLLFFVFSFNETKRTMGSVMFDGGNKENIFIFTKIMHIHFVFMSPVAFKCNDCCLNIFEISFASLPLFISKF